MRDGRQKKKLRLDNGQLLSLRERELLALFRVMTEPDRRLLLSTAEKLISPPSGSGSKTPWHVLYHSFFKLHHHQQYLVIQFEK
jgi:hypothetical protein